MPAASKTVGFLVMLVWLANVGVIRAQTRPLPNTQPHSSKRSSENEAHNERWRAAFGLVPVLPVDITKIDPRLLHLGLRCIGQHVPMAKPITELLTNVLRVVAPAGAEARAADSLERLFGKTEKSLSRTRTSPTACWIF